MITVEEKKDDRKVWTPKYGVLKNKNQEIQRKSFEEFVSYFSMSSTKTPINVFKGEPNDLLRESPDPSNPSPTTLTRIPKSMVVNEFGLKPKELVSKKNLDEELDLEDIIKKLCEIVRSPFSEMIFPKIHPDLPKITAISWKAVCDESIL